MAVVSRRGNAKTWQTLEGYAYLAPALLIIGTFYIFPIFFTLFVGSHTWRIRRGDFIGLDNFQEIFGSFLWLGALVLAVVAIVIGVRLLRQGNVYRLGTRTSLGAGSEAGAGKYGLLPARIVGAGLLAGGISAVITGLPAIRELGDEAMLDSLQVTVWYALGTVPVQLVVGLLIAVLLDQRFRGRQFFRAVYLLPYIVPAVAAAAVFERLLGLRPESLANQVVLIFSDEPLEWLRETRGILEMLFGWGSGEAAGRVAAYWQDWARGPSLALVSIMFFNHWVYSGYYALIFANGLSNIPRNLYEAAEVDGAPKRSVFFRIVLPLVSPSTYFLSLLGLIGTFKAFDSVYVLRNPAARGAADPMSIYIFFTFFRRQRFGYAAALALVLFVIVLGLTIVQRRYMERRVFYGD
ncbi:MAG: carbohydrate ABC transporter permease [Spirochaetaceae bacterium]